MYLKTNYENLHLYCIECKGRISIDEKYAVVPELIYNNETIEKEYCISCCPEESEDDEPYISPEE